MVDALAIDAEPCLCAAVFDPEDVRISWQEGALDSPE